MFTFILHRSLQHCIIPARSLMRDCGVYVHDFFFKVFHSLHVVDLSTLRVIARGDISVWALVCLSLEWAGWVLAIAIVSSIPKVLIEIFTTGLRDEVWIIVVITPSIIFVAPSLIVIARWNGVITSLVGQGVLGAILDLMVWIKASKA